ncbi:MAG: hypothetical protein WCO94_03460 [Verrucomicrobiota bacterium]
MKPQYCTLHPEIKMLDESKGLVEYIASDETLDHYREIIRADGWRFDFFAKNSPFLDSHQGGTIGCLLGKVVDFRVENRRLVETVQWAIEDGADSQLIQFGWKMTKGGFLKAVSVGFFPVRSVNKWENGGQALTIAANDLGLSADVAAKVQTIYLEQQQVELSACVIGANPAALTKALAEAYKADCADRADVEFVSAYQAKLAAMHNISAKQNPQPASAASKDAAAAKAQEQRQAEFLRKFEETIKK